MALERRAPHAGETRSSLTPPPPIATPSPSHPRLGWVWVGFNWHSAWQSFCCESQLTISDPQYYVHCLLITFLLICERDIFSGIIPQFRGLQMNVHAFVMYKLSSCFVNWRASETRVWCTDEICAVLKNHLPSLWLGGTVGFWYQYPMLHRTSITSSNCSEL